MQISTPVWLRKLVKTTRFWQENRLVLREIRSFRRVAACAIVFSIAAAVLAGGSFGLIGLFLHSVTAPQQPVSPTGLIWLDHWVLHPEIGPMSRLHRLAAMILTVVWLQSLCTYLANLYSKYAAIRLVNQLRQKLFDQLQSLSLQYYSTKSSGELVSSVTNEVNQIQQAFNHLSIFVTQGAMLLGCVMAMVWISWPLTLVTAAIFSLLSLCISYLRVKVQGASLKVPKANGHFAAGVLEFISGIRTVHAFMTQEFERQRFQRAIEQIYQSATGVAKLATLVEPLTQGIVSTLLVAMVLGAFHFYIGDGTLEATALFTFLLAMLRTFPLLVHLSNARINFSSLQGSLQNVSELLQRHQKPYLVEGDQVFTGLTTSIDFVNVTFAYEVNEPVLHDLSFSIPQGRMTAIVGTSGAGKSTIADLIPRFYDPTDGHILIDGVDVRAFSLASLRRHLAIVSQDTFIFNASVSDNIAYGLRDVDSASIREAAQQANALDFILALPKAFDTQLGDRGVRLSGGQRQRLAIARALLRHPDILILDEATSALDSLTERLIQTSLEQLSEGRTVIAIAHRLSTIRRADHIIVMEQGRIVEQGSYMDLIQRQGYFWQYHQVQDVHV